MGQLEYGQILKRLHPLVVDQFNKEDLRLLVDVNLTWKLDDIVSDNSKYPTVALEVIDYAKRYGLLVDLVTALASGRPNNADFRQLLTEITPVSPSVAPPPLTSPAPQRPAAERDSRSAALATAGASNSLPPIAGFMSTVTRETPPARPTVFVALPTSDLRGKKDRSAVAEALTQAGYRVVPSVAYPIGDRAAYQAAIDRDLAESLLFVQVLGQLGTPLSNEPPFTWEGLQFARAKARGIPCLRWRPKDKEFDLAAIEQFENVHYQYLTDAVAVSEIPLQDDERVQAGFLEDFRLAVEQRLKRILAVPVPTKTTAAAAASSDLEILLAPFHDDGPVADTFDTLIEQHAISYVVDDDQELQKAFREQAGVVVIWGNSSREWVDARAKEARRLAMGPGRPLLALYVGHPDPHRELVPRPSKFDIIPDGDPDALQKFVEKLRLKRQQSTTGGQS